jgi:signal transduction histidine kinase
MTVVGIAQGTDTGAAVPARPLMLLIAVAGIAAAALALALSLASDHETSPEVQGALMAWITLSYVFAGLVAWWRRPRNHLGPLMIAAGFGVFLSSLTASNQALPFTIGVAFDLGAAVLFLHVCLAFPSGRIGPWERALVGVGYVAAVGAQLVGMALGGFGPDNLLALGSDADTAYTLLRVQLLVLSAIALAGIGFLVARRRRSDMPLRRSLAWLADSFALALLMLAFLYTSAALGLVSGQAGFETIRRLTLFAVGLAPIVFLVGLLDDRLARSAVGDLFVELRGNPGPDELRSALARALRDPSLTLAYWLPEFGSWADADGRPVELPDGTGGRAATLVADRDGLPVAALVHDASLRDDAGLLDPVTAAAAIALENARLSVELRARLEELRGSRARIVEAGDSERRRLERNLHDGAQQRLVAIALQLRLLENRVRDDPDAAEMASAAGEELKRSLNELRELARGLHPAVLEHGLAAALDALAARSEIPTSVRCDVPDRLPEPVELAAYFVVSEALTNVAKYAHAGEASIRAWRDGEMAVVEVSDDGVGGADDSRGSGLRGLADRVEALDGRLRVVSPAGAGTVVTAELPCGP